MSVTSEPRERACQQCGQPFAVSADEQAFLQAICDRDGTLFRPPANCVPCRAERRRQALAVVDDGISEQLTCVDCEAPFTFGTRDKTFFAAQGFSRPRRCRFCRSPRNR